jgi:hypothetical protein
MTCDATREWLLTADDPGRPVPAVAAHLAGCPVCRGLADDLVELENIVRSYQPPPSALARRDAFLAGLPAMAPRPVRARHVLAAFAALAASIVLAVAAVALVRPDPPAQAIAQADPAVVEDLVEWNLKLTEADGPAARERLVRDRLPELQARAASVQADDRALADQLLAHGRKLGGAADPVDEAEGFHELADTLLVRLDTAADDPARSEVYARLYSQVVDRGVHANLERAERQILKADKQARVQNLRRLNKKQAARAAALGERIPEPAREHVKGSRGRPKGRPVRPNEGPGDDSGFP